MPGLSQQSQLIYNSLKRAGSDDKTMSMIPSNTRRKMLISFARRQGSQVQDFLASTQGTILDVDRLRLQKDGSVTAPHDSLNFYPEDEHYFIINDVKLPILPTDVSISMESMPLKDWVIRSEGMAKVKSGRAVIYVNIAVPFVGSLSVNRDLRRIIAQARTIPIAYIDNQLVRQVVYPDSKTKSMAAAITNITIQTHPESPETLVANIAMEMFNYEPFSKHFLFSSMFVPHVDEDTGTKNLTSQPKAHTNPTSRKPANPKNMMKTLKVKSPSQSLLFTQYYDFLLDEGTDFSGDAKIPAELKFTSNAKRYEFKKIGDELDDTITFSYDIYHPIPQLILDKAKKLAVKNALISTKPKKKIVFGGGGSYSSTGQIGGLVGKRIIGLAAGAQSLGSKLFFDKRAGALTGKQVPARNLVEYAIAKFGRKGVKYDQDRRFDEGFVDCSSLVFRTVRDQQVGHIGTWTVSQVATLESLNNAGLNAFLRMPSGHLVPIPIAVNGPLKDDNYNVSKIGKIPGVLVYSFSRKSINGFGMAYRPSHAGLTIGGGGTKHYRTIEAYDKKRNVIIKRHSIGDESGYWERGYFIPNVIYDYSANREEFNYLLGIEQDINTGKFIFTKTGKATPFMMAMFKKHGSDVNAVLADLNSQEKTQIIKKTIDERVKKTEQDLKALRKLAKVNPTAVSADTIKSLTDKLKNLKNAVKVLKSANDYQVTSVSQATSGAPAVSVSVVESILRDTQVELASKAKAALDVWVSNAERFLKIGKKIGWRVVWTRAGTMMFAKRVYLEVTPEKPILSEGGVETTVVSNIAVSINNIFARIPVIGQQYITHQYLGSGDAEANISFTMTGNAAIARLLSMHKYCETASRQLRRVDNVGVIGVKNDVLNLVGLKDCIIDRIEVSTVPESPALYSVQMKITEWKRDQRDREHIKQEFAIDLDTKKRYIELLAKRFFFYAQPRVVGSANIVNPIGGIGLQGTVIDSRPELRLLYNPKKFITVSSIKKNGDDFIYYNKIGGPTVEQATFIAIGEKIQKYLMDLRDTKILAVLGWTEESFIKATNDPNHPFYSFGLLRLLAEDMQGTKRPESIRSLFFGRSTDGTNIGGGRIISGPLFGASSLFLSKLEKAKDSLEKWVKKNYRADIKDVRKKDTLERTIASNKKKVSKAEEKLKALSQNPLVSFMKSYGRRRLLRVHGTDAIGLSGFLQGALELASNLDFAKYLLDAIYGPGVDRSSDQKLLKKLLGPKANEIIAEIPDYRETIISQIDVNTQAVKSVTLNLQDEARLQQLRIAVVLKNFMESFREAIAEVANQAQRQLSLHKVYKSIFESQDRDNIDYGGLPSYQDIPLPRVKIDADPFARKRIVKGKKIVEQQTDLPKTYKWINPDFFFYNADDERATDLDSYYKYESRVMKYVAASQELVYQFGMLPSDSKKDVSVKVSSGGSRNAAVTQGAPGLFAFLGGHLGRHSGQIGATKQDWAARLPDSLKQSLTFQSLTRSIPSGQCANGKMNLAVGDSGITQETTISEEYISLDLSNYDKKKSPLYQGEHPLRNLDGAVIDRVTFGPSGISENRLPVQLDRSPESMMKIFSKSFDSYRRNTFKMRRAMPAFKLYFIEDDTGSVTGSDKSSFVRSYDDFFSFSAVKEIKTVSSRKIPADVVIITVSNLFGYLDDVQYSFSVYDKQDPLRPIDSSRRRESNSHLSADTAAENPFSRFILKEGVRVQLRLGYENDPSYLEKSFNGQIIQINQVSADEIRIICQSFGTQLAAYKKGLNAKALKTQWVDTFDLLSWAVCQPEMTYFGRWQLNNPKSMLESRSTGGWEKVFSFVADPRDDNIFAPSRAEMIKYQADDDGGMFSHAFNAITRGVVNNTGLLKKAEWLRSFGDVDVYQISQFSIVTWDPNKNGPSTGDKSKPAILIKENGKAITFNTYARGDSKLLDYHILRTTIWDIFQEMELRHPGWIARPVPYGNRMTMFFGQPTQVYWHRPMTTRELVHQNDLLAKLRGNIDAQAVLRKQKELIESSKAPWKAVLNRFWLTGWAIRRPMLAFTIGASLVTLGIGGYIALAANAARAAAATGAAVTGAAAAAESSVAGVWFWSGARAALSVASRKAAGFLASRAVAAVAAGGKVTSIGLGLYGTTLAGIGIARMSGLYGPRHSQILYASSVLGAARRYFGQKLFLQSISGRLIPFRRYHMVTSENHIVANTIKASVHDTYNSVSLEYTADVDTDPGAIGTPGSMATKAMKASDRILDKDVRMAHESYPNCRGSWMADRYMQGLLMRYMKDTYKGQLLIIGDPRIRPYDRVLVMDSYTGMVGPIDVERVVHTLVPTSGFLTEITPDLVLYGNNIVDMPFDNYVSAKMAFDQITFDEAIDNALQFNNNLYRKKLVKNSRERNQDYLANATGRRIARGLTKGLAYVAGASVLIGGSIPVALLAAGTYQATKYGTSPIPGISSIFGSFAIKYYEWTTQRQPLLFDPLYVSNKPLLAGISLDKVGLIQNINDRFVPATTNISAGFNLLHKAANDVGLMTLRNYLQTRPLGEDNMTALETGGTKTTVTSQLE